MEGYSGGFVVYHLPDEEDLTLAKTVLLIGNNDAFIYLYGKVVLVGLLIEDDLAESCYQSFLILHIEFLAVNPNLYCLINIVLFSYG